MTAKNNGRGVEYYLNLRYPVTVRELSAEEGGGFLATIPQLGSKTFIADGETPTEALQALDTLRQHLIPELIKNGVALPEPVQDEEAEQFSGSLMLRVPKDLHAKLAAWAKRNGASLNKATTQLLAQALSEQSLVNEMQGYLNTVLEEMRHPGVLSSLPPSSAFPREGYSAAPEGYGSNPYEKAA